MKRPICTCPSIAVAGLSGDSGKTLVALGLAAAWAHRGLRVAPFKKGPDYIDAAWLSLAANDNCRNLDTFLMSDNVILETWRQKCSEKDIAVIEGNRGIYDGMDYKGSHSTATLAKLLNTPIVLVVDVTKMTRTTAALVLGVKNLDPELNILGVVLNKVGGKRHRAVATKAVEHYTQLPVVGAIPRLKKGKSLLPGRHLGLITTDEHPEAIDAINYAREVVEEHLDIDLIFEKASTITAKTEFDLSKCDSSSANEKSSKLEIGVIRDAAFPFYYPENLELPGKAGARIVEISALNDKKLPETLDALYVGGGFPETHAKRLSENRGFLKSLKLHADKGLPIYAECGGLMLLTRSIEYEGEKFPMANILPVEIGWSIKPAGHGYTKGRIDRKNPFYPVGTEISGHEFHHSLVKNKESIDTAIFLNKGNGVGEGRDGFVMSNVLALYTHIHASGTPAWVEGLIKAASSYKSTKNKE